MPVLRPPARPGERSLVSTRMVRVASVRATDSSGSHWSKTTWQTISPAYVCAQIASSATLSRSGRLRVATTTSTRGSGSSTVVGWLVVAWVSCVMRFPHRLVSRR